MEYTHKILIVEDDKDIEDLVAINLSSAGLQTKHVFDGALASAHRTVKFWK